MIALRWRATIRSSCLKKCSYYSFNCLSEKKDPLWWARWISFIKAYLIYCKTKPKKIINNVEIWSTGREINSAVLHSTNEAQWSILKVFYTKNGKNMEAELKIQMKVLNKEQAIVSVYSLGCFRWIFPAFLSAQ